VPPPIQAPTAEPPAKKQDDVAKHVIDNLEDYADEMRTQIEIKDHPNGWFGVHPRCAQGSDIFQWVLKHIENRKQAAFACQKMLEKKFIIAVDEAQNRIFNVKNLYRFHVDREDIADNMIKVWHGEAGDAKEVSENLVNLATELYQQAIVEDSEEEEEDTNTIDVEKAI
jgi:hypothetical protein